MAFSEADAHPSSIEGLLLYSQLLVKGIGVALLGTDHPALVLQVCLQVLSLFVDAGQVLQQVLLCIAQRPAPPSVRTIHTMPLHEVQSQRLHTGSGIICRTGRQTDGRGEAACVACHDICRVTRCTRGISIF